MNLVQAAEAVLSDSRRAMKVDDLWAEIRRRQLVDVQGDAPKAMLRAELGRNTASVDADSCR